MQCHTLSRIALLLVLVPSLSAQSTGLISQVRSLAWAKDVQKAQEVIERHHTGQKQITPEWVAAYLGLPVELVSPNSGIWLKSMAMRHMKEAYNC